MALARAVVCARPAAMPDAGSQTETVIWPYRPHAVFSNDHGYPDSIMDVMRHVERTRPGPRRYLHTEEQIKILTDRGRAALQRALSSIPGHEERRLGTYGLVLACLEYEHDHIGLVGTFLIRHYKEECSREFNRILYEVAPSDHLGLEEPNADPLPHPDDEDYHERRPWGPVYPGPPHPDHPSPDEVYQGPPVPRSWHHTWNPTWPHAPPPPPPSRTP